MAWEVSAGPVQDLKPAYEEYRKREPNYLGAALMMFGFWAFLRKAGGAPILPTRTIKKVWSDARR